MNEHVSFLVFFLSFSVLLFNPAWIGQVVEEREHPPTTPTYISDTSNINTFHRLEWPLPATTSILPSDSDISTESHSISHLSAFMH
jgi:hypothetical protein